MRSVVEFQPAVELDQDIIMVRVAIGLLRLLAAAAATIAVSAELADDFNIPKGWRMQVCVCIMYK